MGSLTPGALAAVIEAVAPFSLVLDEEGRIVHAGPAMSRLVPGARAGSYFKDVFEATRPTDLETFLRPAKGLRFFQDRSRALKFKGSVKLIDGGVHLLAANPLINAEQTIGMLGITFSDLPPHDSIAEYVFLQQSYDTSLLEARQALETARQQEDALRAVIDSSTDRSSWWTWAAVWHDGTVQRRPSMAYRKPMPWAGPLEAFSCPRDTLRYGTVSWHAWRKMRNGPRMPARSSCR
jgi:hypothetical protein